MEKVLVKTNMTQNDATKKHNKTTINKTTQNAK